MDNECLNNGRQRPLTGFQALSMLFRTKHRGIHAASHPRCRFNETWKCASLSTQHSPPGHCLAYQASQAPGGRHVGGDGGGGGGLLMGGICLKTFWYSE